MSNLFKNKFFVPALVLVAVILIAAAVYFFRSANTDYVAVINNERISAEEFYLYLYEQKTIFENDVGADVWEIDFDGEPSENIAKQSALNSIMLVKASVAQSKKTGLALSEAEKRSAAENAAKTLADVNGQFKSGIKISEVTLTAVMRDNAVYQKLFDKITESYEPNEADFEAYYYNYLVVNTDAVRSDALKSFLHQQYTLAKKEELFNKECEKWFNKEGVKINRKVWDSISVKNL